MAELAFDCLDVAPLAYAAEPTLNVRVRVSETTGEQIHVIALRAWTVASCIGLSVSAHRVVSPNRSTSRSASSAE